MNKAFIPWVICAISILVNIGLYYQLLTVKADSKKSSEFAIKNALEKSKLEEEFKSINDNKAQQQICLDKADDNYRENWMANCPESQSDEPCSLEESIANRIEENKRKDQQLCLDRFPSN